ncbi:MAG: DNA-binding protein [Alishewanella aestuarii]
MNLNSGHFIEGVLKGFHIKKSRPNANGVVRETLQVGIAYFAESDFGEVEQIFTLTVPKPLVDAGIPSRMSELNGRHVRVPYSMRDWEMNGRNGTIYQLHGKIKEFLDRGLIEVKPQVKAA